MFICNNCKQTFSEPNTYSNRSECFGAPAYEQLGGCPHCFSEDYEPAEQCIECGEYYPADWLPGFCELCIEYAKKFYTPTLGKIFVDSTEDRQRAFYLIGYWEHKGHFPEHRRKEFIHATKTLEGYKEYEKENLKEFCLEDLGEWAEFVYEYSRDLKSSKYEERKASA